MPPQKANKNKGFTTTEIQNITKVSARKLRWWDQQGLIKPGAFPGRKRCQTRRYTLQNVVCVLVIKALRDKGVSLQKIRESVDRIKITGVDLPLAKLRVACLAHSIVFKRDGKFFDPLSGQLAIEEALEVIRPHFERRRISHLERSVERANTYYQKKMAEF
jgi:DNA-binding transcriptional MerR regulator